MNLSREFFTQIARIESKNSISTIDTLIAMYSKCVEFYDQHQDPIKYYFLEKIQYTLSQDHTIEHITRNSNRAATTRVSISKLDPEILNTSIRSKQTIHKINFQSQLNQETQNQQLNTLLESHHANTVQKDAIIRENIHQQNLQFRDRLKQRQSQSITRSMSQCPSYDAIIYQT
ncbi:unnamed protein product (macronuclear) [Paramecium tetraurelia]|uniref:Uncharacterized protein n=1 Tax=Paramecium tetraurelia TaxID=5888 RepID=A0DSS2_PARTE|nr:uncharacterized protein GSPATT00019782001 [Paramecium tetraurelia]CAK86089.1 unnamed protein product [Paramecium tetraurelia]|eukprot:XP_001453486.1 hypothetical protein (macronuclear) [Paramecium tetraurelia strain d4-2]